MIKLKAVKNLHEENFLVEMVSWRGNEYTFGELQSEFDLERFYYEEAIRAEEGQRKLLFNYKLIEKELRGVTNGIYVKNIPQNR